MSVAAAASAAEKSIAPKISILGGVAKTRIATRRSDPIVSPFAL
jgi:hypothetical protein